MPATSVSVLIARVCFSGILRSAQSVSYTHLEDNAHLTVVDFLENFPDDRFEINSDKTHAVGAAKAVPQIMRYLTHANFMRRAAKVKDCLLYTSVFSTCSQKVFRTNINVDTFIKIFLRFLTIYLNILTIGVHHAQPGPC